MKVTCPICRLNYNDIYRLTFCPHQKFAISPAAAELLRQTGTPAEEPYEERPTDSVA